MSGRELLEDGATTLVEVLRRRAERQAGRRAYTFLLDGETRELHVTYGELDLQARAIAARLQALGVAGERALLLYPAGLQYAAAFLGCLYAGVAAVPVYPPRPNRPDPRVLSILADARARAVLTTSAILPNAERLLGGEPGVHWLATDGLDLDAAAEWRQPSLRPDDLAFLQYTSGSTSAPKGVMVSHGNLVHNERLIQRALAVSEESVAVGWLPLYHDMGLIGNLLGSLWAGCPCVLMSPVDFLQRPMRWLEAISRHGGEISGGPDFAYDLCARKVKEEELERLDLSRWRLAFNGAEPVRAETLERFAAAFAPAGFRREAFYPCYGLAEATLFVSGGGGEGPAVGRFKVDDLAQRRAVEAGPEEEGRALVASGRPAEGQDVTIVDPESLRPVADGEVGEVWIRGASVAGGYWSRPELTEASFRAATAAGEGPYLRTGDLGFLHADQLFVAGRLKDLIIVRGRNHYPQDVELTVEKSHPALRPGCGAAFAVEAGGEERLAVVQEVRRDARDADWGEVLETVRRAVAEEHEVQPVAVVLIRTATLPKTSSGKVRRQACREAFLAGELSVLAEWRQEAPAAAEAATVAGTAADVGTPAGAVAWLAAEVAARTGVPAAAVDPHQPLSRLGLDSLGAMELAHAVEERLGLPVPMETFFEGETLAGLVAQAFNVRGSLGVRGTASVPVAAEPAEAEHPLSHGQRALWFLHQLEPESPAYNVPAALTIEGELDTEALRRAIQALVDRHPVLRTTFAAPLGEPVARVRPQMELPFVEESAARWPAEALAARLAEEAERPFDLAAGPLLRVHLFERSKQEHVLLVVLHHAATDFWSQAVLLEELGEIYRAERAGEPAVLPLAASYSGFVRWQREMLASPRGARLRDYWRERLGGELAVLDLPTDRPRPPVQTYPGATVRMRLPAALAGRLSAVAREREATPFMALLAAFQALLHRYTGQADLPVGVPTAGRGRAGLAGVVGYFVNPVVLRSDVSANPTFEELLAQVRGHALGAFEHQDYPFPLLVEDLQPERDPSRPPLFQVMFVLQRAPRIQGQDLTPFALNEPEARVVAGGLPVVSTPLPERFAQFDLTLTMGELEDGLVAAFNYNTDLLDETTVWRMAHHFETLLAGIAEAPASRLADLPLLTRSERHRLLVKWNHTRAWYPEDAILPEMFERQVDQTPEAPAVVHGGTERAYRELDRRANRLAHHLLKLGVEPGELMGIFLDRSHELVEAVLGALKAGAAYVPLDPEYPRERLAFLLADSGARRVLTVERLRPLLPPLQAGVEALCLDTLAEAIEGENDERPPLRVLPAEVACVVYTSGSTGQPKGVALTHGGIVNLIVSFIRSYSPGIEDRMLPLTSVASASFVGEVFPILCADGALVLPDREQVLDTAKLVQLIAEANVSILSTVPSLIATLNAMKDELPRLRLILAGGEALTAGDVDRILESATIVNGYGLTETTVCSTIYTVGLGDLQSGGPLPIGRPLMNHRLYVLDPELNLMPLGCTGQLYVAGDGLARGYLNNPALTADRFVPDPFGDGGRMYRTGDLASWRPDGNIVYRGRGDQQVKVRGFRIELGEIETVLGAHPGVAQAAVVPRQEGGDKRLVAYVVAAPGEAPSAGDLLAWLRERLPEYMVPAAFVFLPALPLSPNGKVDARSLPAPERARPELEAAYAAPKSELERIVAAVWGEALGVEKVGIHDNFFDLGGHSLLLAKVHARLREVLERELSLVDLFKNPTVASLAAALSRPAPAAGAPRASAAPARKAEQPASGVREAVAVIGMAGRWPGARSVDELWETLREGREGIRTFTEEELLAAGVDPELVANPDYVKAKGVLGDVDLFDAGLFGLSPREVELMDPQHRLFLECCWEALERAGYNSGRPLARVGVFGGESMNTYLITNLVSHLELVASADTLAASLGNDKDPLTSRVSYKLNLKGPSITIQSASSTSLVAVHVAVQSLLNRDCDMALAGGVSIHLPEVSGYMYHDGGTTSPDGHCRAFDARAKGFVSGHGAGIVVLKRLADALRDGDPVHAVIKGSACNNDGSLKVSYTAPSVDGQIEVYAAAYENAGVTPDTLSYVECHGTATPMGDPIEIAALTQAFRAHTDRRGFCAIGSLKTNIGHLDSAAGVSGLIKAVLALEHKQIPASLHFERPNPQIDFANSPFFVNTELREWKSDGRPRRAGVTSLGMGGTNAHVILEEAPALAPSGSSRPQKLLLLSAHTESALEAATDRLAAHLESHPLLDLADVAFTLHMGRRPFVHRRALLAGDLGDAARALASRDPQRLLTTRAEPGERPVVFLFTGQGSQYPGMGKGLYEAEPAYRDVIDRCSELLKPHLGLDLRELLFPPAGEEEAAAERLKQTAVAQPALFVVEYALATLWMQWGVRPEAMLGHSLGEYVAACLAGVFSLRDALATVAIRGRLMQDLPPGAMLAVPLPESDVLPLLGPDLSLAAVNRPSLCVAAGPAEAVADLRARLEARGIEGRPLHTSHAFHSAMMDPILKPFGEWMSNVRLSPPRLPYLSNLTGTWIRPEEATDPAYWAEHIRCPVRFSDGLAELLREPDRVLVEVGPGNVLTTLARQHPARTPRHTVLPSLRHPREAADDLVFLQESLARLWLAGAEIDWSGYHEGRGRRRVPLPTYPFQRERYWVEPRKDARPAGAGKRRRDLGSWFYAPSWRQAPPAVGAVGTSADAWSGACLVFLDEHGLGAELAAELERRGRTVFTVVPGEVFARTDERAFTVDTWSAAGYDALLAELDGLGARPGAVVHLWGVTAGEDPGLDRSLERGFHSLVFLAQALGKRSATDPVRILAVTDGLQSVTGEEELMPEKATLLGPCGVIPREYPTLACRSLDVALPKTNGDSLLRLAVKVAAELDLDWEGAGGPVALRGSYRWVRDLAPAPLPAGDSTSGGARLRERGVYLITGGLGGLGLALAADLARTAAARLVLVGRTPLPERADWDGFLSTHDAGNPVSRRIAAVRGLEAAGAEVLVAAADVADAAALASVVEEAEARFGAVHGVIHAAGRPGGGIVQVKTREAAEAVLAPKVRGALALEEVFRGRPLDFLALFSSVTAVLPQPGQVDYAAANAFLDAFAQARAARGGPVLSIGWDAWREVGMAVETEVPAELREWRQAELKLGMTTAEGVEAFRRALGSPAPWRVVSTHDLAARLEANASPHLLAELEKAHAPRASHPRPALANACVPPSTDAERRVAAVWEELLGIEGIGVHDNFFDLGGNSLMAIRIISRLKAELGVDVSEVSLFEGPTVAGLARILLPEDGGDDGGESFDERRSRGEKRRAARRARRATAEVT